MSWSIGFDDRWSRWIGYGVPAYCDYPRCGAEIDRGLSFVCGGEPFGGDDGCGLFFCEQHLQFHTFRNGVSGAFCSRCCRGKDPFTPKPEHPKWIRHLLTDPSWEAWRLEHPKEVVSLKASLCIGIERI